MDGRSVPFRVGRQPIFDSKLAVHGYELLFRGPGPSDADTMTADVLVHSGLDLGLPSLVGNKPAYVNATLSYLVGEQEIPFSPKEVVVEVLEDVPRDPEVVAGCRQLTLNGYTIALDDYVWGGDDDPLLQFASVVKLDVLALPFERLTEMVLHCSAYGVQLVAEKVETREQLLTCEALGFDLYQGYLLSRPGIVEGRALTPAKLACLQALDKLCDPSSSFEELEAVVKRDGSLSARFLRAAGAGTAHGLYRRLRSVRDALVVLGERRLRAWLSLMLLAGTEGSCEEQFAIAMARARMAELMAEKAAPGLADAAFTVGLVSSLNVLLGVPLPAVVEAMSLSPEVGQAVINHSGRLGVILSDVLAQEFGDIATSPLSGLSAGEVSVCYLEALGWANEVCSVFSSPDEPHLPMATGGGAAYGASLSGTSS
jgi:EAL and modified HD-GYP domain-containing signal transduction protein